MHYDSSMARAYVIAEIGTSHGGDVESAERLIRAAREAGADCAKFQWVIAEEIVHPAMTPIDLPSGSIPLYERFRSLERPAEFYESLMESCARHGIEFLCTPFGSRSAAGLRDLGAKMIKIASPELNHLALLDEVRTYAVRLVLSTGVSRLEDIERALDHTGRSRPELLHCITSYPAPEEEYNLRLIQTLGKIFGVPVGLSDHSIHPELVPCIAAALGAHVVEKHFTLSRSGAGLDDPIALDPGEFARMVAAIRQTEEVRDEHGEEAALAALGAQFGADKVAAILGDGVKRLAPSEAAHYQTTRRSILTLRDLPEGHRIANDDVAALRSESLRAGMEPGFLPEILGARLRRAVPAGTGLRWTDLIH